MYYLLPSQGDSWLLEVLSLEGIIGFKESSIGNYLDR